METWVTSVVIISEKQEQKENLEQDGLSSMVIREVLEMVSLKGTRVLKIR